MNLTEHITPGGPLLEVLRRAEASLRDEPYEFRDWTLCTCGHIYAATGQRVRKPTDVRLSNDPTYLQVVDFIVSATGGAREDALATDTLSMRTLLRAVGPAETGCRAAALQLIRTAIAKCEAEQLAAMHTVADEAQRVVSLVDVPESVMA